MGKREEGEGDCASLVLICGQLESSRADLQVRTKSRAGIGRAPLPLLPPSRLVLSAAAPPLLIRFPSKLPAPCPRPGLTWLESLTSAGINQGIGEPTPAR